MLALRGVALPQRQRLAPQQRQRLAPPQRQRLAPSRHRARSPARTTASQRASTAMAAAPVRVVSGVGELADAYDTLLLDQYGVLHDGRTAYPAALAAVQRLAEAGKRLVVLSNSGRRADDTLAKLQLLGFERAWFAGAVTSGELTHIALTDRTDPFFAALGPSCLHFTWAARGAISVDSLGLTHVTDAAHADFVLAHGMEAVSNGDSPVEVSLAEIRAQLQTAAARRLPLIIANPDIVTVDKTHLVPMPGQCGVWYKEFGGPPAKIMGKPAEVIYRAAEIMAGGGRVLAVGDSLSHDILGASGAGLDSLFIAAGIHADEIGALTAEGVQQLAAGHACPAPTYAAQFFRW
jgi:HAD superfamily hydrolase (TIGR01459 family)